MKLFGFGGATPATAAATTKTSSKKGLILLMIIIFFIVGVNIFKYYKSKTTASKPAQASTTQKAELLLFYTDWCPHCIAAKPEWNKFKEEYKSQTVNGYKLVFNEVNCTKESPESEKMMEKYGVEGYPTIKLVVNGKTISFDAKPTKENLVKFVNTALN
jgi:thiol-disulfide isomerase/thioredoxin